MSASQLRDWIACPTLWRLRRDQPPASTMRAEDLVRRISVGELTGTLAVGAEVPDVRWSETLPYLHTATAIGRHIARRVREALDHRGWHLAGYHDTDLSALEAVGGEMLCWWLLDVGTRSSPEAWLVVAEIAEQRPETTHVAMMDVRLRRWPAEPTITVCDPRPVGPISHELRHIRAAQGDTATARTPGLHCRRCPDLSCPVRRDS